MGLCVAVYRVCEFFLPPRLSKMDGESDRRVVLRSANSFPLMARPPQPQWACRLRSARLLHAACDTDALELRPTAYCETICGLEALQARLADVATQPHVRHIRLCPNAGERWTHYHMVSWLRLMQTLRQCAPWALRKVTCFDFTDGQLDYGGRRCPLLRQARHNPGKPGPGAADGCCCLWGALAAMATHFADVDINVGLLLDPTAASLEALFAAHPDFMFHLRTLQSFANVSIRMCDL